MKRIAKRQRGFDSSFEQKISDELYTLTASSGCNYEFSYNTRCKNAETIAYYQVKNYYPDFVLNDPNGNFKTIYIECKGWFKPSDRTKMLAVRDANPGYDIRLVFQHDNWLTKNKKQRYSDWAKRHGFKYAVGGVPEAWITQPA